MFKVEVEAVRKGTPERKIVWRGEMPWVPRVGDAVNLHDDWGAVYVDRTTWDAVHGVIYLHIYIGKEEEWPTFTDVEPETWEH